MVLLACIIINFLICTVVIIRLCCKHFKNTVDNCIFLQIALTMACLIFNGIGVFLYFQSKDETKEIREICNRFVVITFLLS